MELPMKKSIALLILFLAIAAFSRPTPGNFLVWDYAPHGSEITFEVWYADRETPFTHVQTVPVQWVSLRGVTLPVVCRFSVRTVLTLGTNRYFSTFTSLTVVQPVGATDTTKD